MPSQKLVLTIPLLLAVSATVAEARGVRVEFDPTSPAVGPFPSDFLTVPDSRQRTGLRINLPLPSNCAAAPSDCGEVALLNQLDGFSTNARATVKFSGAINPETLRAGVVYVWSDPLVQERFHLFPNGTVFPINQPVYDPVTRIATAKPDNVLESSRRYLLIVTDEVRDAAGDPVETDPGFQACLDGQVGGDYCSRLAAALSAARGALGGRRVVAASLFTTLSASAWFEQARVAVRNVPAGFQRAGANNVLQASALRAISLANDVNSGGPLVNAELPAPPQLLATFGVGRIAFASIRSPRFLGATLTSPATPTGEAMMPPAQGEELPFHVFLPAAPMPAGGYPVVIAGHGIGDSRFGMPTVMSAATAAGFAVLSINAFGHGFGPRSVVRVTLTNGETVEFPAGGRGVDIDRNGRIDPFEGCILLAPGAPLGGRECFRQTVADYMQLVRAMADGMDLDGDGRADLNGARIAYIGQSLGAAYGTLLMAAEPGIVTAVLNVGPGTLVDTLRLSPGFRATAGVPALGIRQPSLLNVGATAFDEEIPLRFESTRIATKPGSAALRDFFERAEWLDVSPAMALAPHLKQATLPGLPVKNVLFQIASGDQTVPNPSNSLLIRAANMREQTVLYRHDLARVAVPTLPANPHTFLIPLGNPAQQAIGLAALQQAIGFVQTGGQTIPDVNPLVRVLVGRDLFETPALLPEELGF